LWAVVLPIRRCRTYVDLNDKQGILDKPLGKSIIKGMEYLETVLGRRVTHEIDAEKDMILKALYESYHNFFNTKDPPTPMSLRLLAQSIGLTKDRTKVVCKLLIKKSLLKSMPPPYDEFYHITPEGIEFVEKTGLVG